MLNASFQLYQAKRYVEAITMAKAVLDIDPNSADAYNNLAVSYAALNQWEAAINNVQAALRVDSNHQLAKNNLAWILQQRQDAATTAVTVPEGSPEFFLNKSLRESEAGDNAASPSARRGGGQRERISSWTLPKGKRGRRCKTCGYESAAVGS